MSIVVLINDLIFESRIRAAAADAGIAVSFGKDAELVEMLLGTARPALVIIDLNTAGPSAVDAVKKTLAHPCRPRVVCFVSHVDRELADVARAAGAEVMPRSTFVQRLSEIMAAATGEPPTR